MAEPVLLVRDEGPVRWLTLNRPDARNALDGALVQALADALDDARPSTARCLAITGAGRVFSAGADLKALASPPEESLADSRRLAALLRAVTEHPLPVIAAVNGHALGGGAGLVAACDLAVAAEDATLAFPEVRVGFVPAIVLSFLLRDAGEKAARELCLTGRRVDAAEARDLGLLNDVVPADALAARVGDLAARIAEGGPEAVAATKRLFLALRGRPLAEALDEAARTNAQARAHPECREGVAAFLGKRRPGWTREVEGGPAEA